MGIRRCCFGLVALAAVGWACGGFDEEKAPAPKGDAGVDATVPTEAGPSDAGATSEEAAPDASSFRFVFVTAGTHDGKFGQASVDSGLAGADDYCANEALGTPLAGRRWRAWLGTNRENPRDRIADAGAFIPYDYRLVTGELVFRAGYKFVPGALTPLHDIDRDQSGNPVLEAEVWTGAYVDGLKHGSPDFHCVDWSTSSDGSQAITGFTTRRDAGSAEWQATSNGFSRQCDKSHHIYCFEIDP